MTKNIDHQEDRPKAMNQPSRSRGCARNRRMLARGRGGGRVAAATAGFSVMRRYQK